MPERFNYRCDSSTDADTRFWREESSAISIVVADEDSEYSDLSFFFTVLFHLSLWLRSSLVSQGRIKCRDKITGTRVRTKFYNIIDLIYVNDYNCDTRSRPQIIGAIYLHIPMHSPVDRAAVERCELPIQAGDAPRRARARWYYTGTRSTLLAYFVSTQFLRPTRPSIRFLQRNLVFHCSSLLIYIYIYAPWVC